MTKTKEDYKEKFEKLPINYYEKLEERLHNYISYATSRVDYFSNLNRFYFQINLSLMVAFSMIFPFIFIIFGEDSPCFVNTIIWGILVYLGFSFYNICLNLCKNYTKFPKENGEEKATTTTSTNQNSVEEKNTNNSKKNKKNPKLIKWISKPIKWISKKVKNLKENRRKEKIKKLKEDLLKEKFWKTLWFHKNNAPERKYINDKEIMEMYLYYFAEKFILKSINPSINTNLEENKPEAEYNNDMKIRLLRDDIKDLFELYCYHSNYKDIAIRTRRRTLRGILVFIVFLGVGFVSLLSNICLLELIWLHLILFFIKF